MKQTIYEPSKKVPTANLAVNKSRIKVYYINGKPTYYLQGGQEFQIELFNPTEKVLLAKITLNGNVISQGGLVINPGQRIFLERYLDVAKKFLFETYEVEKSDEVQKAIAKNGDFKVEFFEESENFHLNFFPFTPTYYGGSFGGPTYVNLTNNTGGSVVIFDSNPMTTNINTAYFSSVGDYNSQVVQSSYSKGINNPPQTRGILKSKNVNLEKDLLTETGRVAAGSDSNQKMKTVDKDFKYFPCHIVAYKLLPLSQKINTSDDINVKKYCTNCGAKLGKTDKFCSSCGKKA